MFRLKLKAGALQFTTFITVVIALLLTAFILLVHTHKQFQVQSDFIIETTRLSNKGIDYCLKHSIRLNDTTTLNIDNETYKTLKVFRDFWGVFEKVISRASIKHKQFQKVALVGAKQSERDRTCLYVQDNNKPLVLVGNTKVEGMSFLPKQGVRTGNISGDSYYGSQLIYGATRVSSSLPELASEITNSLFRLKNINSTISQNQFLNLQEGEAYSNSFFEPLQMAYSNTAINLRGVALTGHILVQSKSKISVYPSSNLKDVVLIAPEIEIKSNTVGNFQAIATKGILVQKDVQLNYPSALVLNTEKSNKPKKSIIFIEEENAITIEKNTIIKGVVAYLGEKDSNNYKPQVLLDDGAIIHGELYNTQNTELKGKVYGTVFTDNFLVNYSGSVYQNHIYNGTININKLPQEYVGLQFNDSKKDVLKWLY